MAEIDPTGGRILDTRADLQRPAAASTSSFAVGENDDGASAFSGCSDDIVGFILNSMALAKHFNRLGERLRGRC
jgi:hypothetical protein